MPKRNYPQTNKRKVVAKPIVKSAPVRTEVRNSAVPRAVTPVSKPAPRKEITHEMIAVRAYEIFCSGTGGCETDNWHRAERELRDGV
jgi:hypothetical protein